MLAVWRMMPTMNMAQPVTMVNRRPMKSAMSPAMRAPARLSARGRGLAHGPDSPKKVPADRIDVMSDLSSEGSWKAIKSCW